MTDEIVPWYLKNYKQQFSSKTNNRILGPIEEVLIAESLERDSYRDTLHCHPSEMAKELWCPRSTYYKVTDTEPSNPQSFNLHRLNIFAEGHEIHDKWQRWLHKTGLLFGNWKCRNGHIWWDKSPEFCPECFTHELKYAEIPIYNEEYKIIGHADGGIEDAQGKALLEIKSVGLGTIRWDAPALYKGYEDGDLTIDELWKRIKRPLAAHNRQIQLYMWATDIHKAIVLYEWKPTQEVKEFHLTYEETTVAPMLNGATQVMLAVEDEIPPPRPVAATSKSSAVCKFCEYKDKCWSERV